MSASKSRSVQVQYDSIPYSVYRRDLLVPTIPIHSPIIKLKSLSTLSDPNFGKKASLPIEYDGFYCYIRKLNTFEHNNKCHLVHIDTLNQDYQDNLDHKQESEGDSGGGRRGGEGHITDEKEVIPYQSYEEEIDNMISSISKIDAKHMIVLKGKELDIWKIRSDYHPINLHDKNHSINEQDDKMEDVIDKNTMETFLTCCQNSVNVWQNETDIHLITPSTLSLNHCLIADTKGIQVIRLDTPSQSLCNFPENDTVTSIKWHLNENGNVFSSTIDEGMIKIYDLRTKVNVASQFIHKGIFEHVLMSNPSSSLSSSLTSSLSNQSNEQYNNNNNLDHQIICGGLDGIISIFDNRKLGQPLLQHRDAFFKSIYSMSSSYSSDLIICGYQGFCLYNLKYYFNHSKKLFFRQFYNHGLGMEVCFKQIQQQQQHSSSLIKNPIIISTDMAGNFREFSMKEFNEKNHLINPLSISPKNRIVNELSQRNQNTSQNDVYHHHGDYIHPSISSSSSSSSNLTPTSCLTNSIQAMNVCHQDPSSSSSSSLVDNNHSGDWDWDIDFWSDKPIDSENGTPSSNFDQTSPRVYTSNHDNAPKEIDELIGYYFS